MRLGLIVGALVCLVVAGLMLLPDHGAPPGWVALLPHLDAALNGASFLLLVAGFLAIRRGARRLHRAAMLGAFSCSLLFLLGYVTYHALSPGPTPYVGPYRGLYLGLLLVHVVLAVLVLPLAITTLHRAWTGALHAHKALAPRTLLLWLCASGSGVVVYWMLRG